MRRLANETVNGRYKEDTDGFIHELNKLSKKIEGRKNKTLVDD